MGLRVNADVGALTALRNLRNTQKGTFRALERISTGLKINRASDNPAGLIIAEQIRSQLGGLQQAFENTQNGQNLLRTADAGLGQISDLVVEARSLAVRAQDSTLGNAAKQALQFSLDQNLAAIDRIASTTRFSDTPLLNGGSGFNVTQNDAELTNIRVSSATLDGSGTRTVDVDVQSAATTAQAAGTLAATQTGDVRFEIQGSAGSAIIELADGATLADAESAINAVTDQTGVESVGGQLFSTEAGSNQFVDVQNLSGDLDGVTAGRTEGTDAVATIDGAAAAATGNTISLEQDNLDVEIDLAAGATGNFSFTLDGGGLEFQIGELAGESVSYGIPNAGINSLGDPTLGTLSSLRTGQANSLLNDPGAASQILDNALTQVNRVRGEIGALDGQFLERTNRALEVHMENLTASVSDIRDADFAAELANLTRGQILNQTGIFALQNFQFAQSQVIGLLS
jgi:flagellin